jgi:RNA polymerase sigma factor (sigma-70 family)
MLRSPAGDAAFRSLYAHTFDAVARYCLRRLPPATAHDAVAEVFLVAWRRIDDVPPADEALPWLFGVARNVVRNTERSSRRSHRLEARLASQPVSTDPGPEPLVVRRDEERRLLQALDSLPPVDREVVRLRAYEELTFSQIGQAIGCSEEAAKKRVTRALRRLRSGVGPPSTDPSHHPSPRASQEGEER